jgi:serine/threonine protein kinase
VSSDPRIGTQIADYRIERLVGRGGMSVVYLAEHVRLHRKAALKLLSPDLAEDPTFRARFVSEWERLAQLDHPNIIPVFEAGEADGLLYIAMRYVKTTDLKGLIEQEGQLDPERAIRIVAQTASALDAAHSQDLVHRDVKPANILVAAGAGLEGTDHVYLSDFGLTKHTQSRSGLTQTGHFMGTIDYVAPEQITGKGVDGRTDQYALACVLYQCLTGSVPYPREEETAALFAHLQEPPPRATELRRDLPMEVDAVIGRAMAKLKEERFETCTDFAREARAALNVTAPSVTERPAPQISETVLATPPRAGTAGGAAGSAAASLPSAPSIDAPPQPPPTVPPMQPPSGKPAGGRRAAIIGVVAVAAVAIGVVAITQFGGDGDGGADGNVLLRDEFEDPNTGWETESDFPDEVTQGYVDGRYEIRFLETAQPNRFAVAADGADSVDSGNVQVSAEVTILGEPGGREGFGLSCRVGPGSGALRSAYYVVVGANGGWAIQKLTQGQDRPETLAAFDEQNPDANVPAPVDAGGENEVQVACTGPDDGPVTLALSVNGAEIASAVDDGDQTPVLPPGGAGMAAAGPNRQSPAGFAIAFDEFIVEDLSGGAEASA